MSPNAQRRAWMIVGGVVAAGIVVVGTLQIIDALVREQKVTTASLAASDIDTVEIHTDSGQVDVETAEGDGGEIALTTTVDAGLFRPHPGVSDRNGTLTLDDGCPPVWIGTCEVSFRLRVPAGLAVVVRSSNGDVAVAGVQRGVDVDTDNGDVSVDRVSGRVSVSSDNGDIRGRALRADDVKVRTDNGSVSLEFTDAPDRIDVASDNGDIDVSVPDVDGAYAPTTATDNGSVSIEIATDPASRRTIEVRTDNGDISLRPQR